MKRQILCYAVAVALAALAYGADGTTTAKKSTAAKGAPKRKSTVRSTAVRKPGTTATARSRTGKKAVPVKRTTWRNRQMAPTPERYKEIQDALVAKGCLKPEEAGSGWSQNSIDALKRFQGEQNLEASGKINSLSLIALGLGPKHEPAAPKPPDSGPSQDR